MMTTIGHSDMDLQAALEADLADAERKAWDALARWKFWMFGYHAADCIKIKRRLGRSRESFFKELVEIARTVMAQRYGVAIGCGDAYLVWSTKHSAWWRADRAGYTTSLAQAGRYGRDEAIDIAATSRDGYTSRMIPDEIPVRLDAAMLRKPDQGVAWLVTEEDDTECKRREASRLTRAA